MNTFSFKLYGGYTVSVVKDEVTIKYAGEKVLFFTRSKPREKTFSLKDVIRVDYKESSSMMFGYVRFVTEPMDQYVSSVYMARHDEYSFMVERDEVHQLNAVLNLVKKAAPKMSIVKNKS